MPQIQIVYFLTGGIIFIFSLLPSGIPVFLSSVSISGTFSFGTILHLEVLPKWDLFSFGTTFILFSICTLMSFGMCPELSEGITLVNFLLEFRITTRSSKLLFFNVYI